MAGRAVSIFSAITFTGIFVSLLEIGLAIDGFQAPVLPKILACGSATNLFLLGSVAT
jgi:hypothetical protein